jgi:hypothetical protein
MLAQTSVQFGSLRLMFGNPRHLADGLIVSLAALAFVSGLVMFDLSVRAAADAPEQTVTRALKSDRLPLAPSIHSDVASQPVERAPRTSIPDLKLPDGCEAVVSSIANPELAHIAGRCVS